MAKPSISDEEILLKKRARRRLIGAIALVTLVIVLLPQVLDEKPKQPEQNIAISIPERKDGGFASKIVPLEAAAPPAATLPGIAANGAEAVPETAPQPEPAAPPPAEKQAAEKPSQPAAKEAKQPASSADGFVVQLGAFSNAANAKQLQARLAAQKIASYTDILKTPKGDKTRVRAGPFPTREEAEKVRDRLKKMGVNGVVASRAEDKEQKAAGKK